jgi:hypothetical protein
LADRTDVSFVFGCDSFLALRNVLLGDLGTRLQPHKVVAMVDPSQLEGSRRAAEGSVIHVEPLSSFDPWAVPGVADVLTRSYRTRKAFFDPTTQWVALRTSVSRRSSGIRYYADLLRSRAAFERDRLRGRVIPCQKLRESAAHAVQSMPEVRLVADRLEQLHCRTAAGFSPEGYREIALMEAARLLGIPSAVMIRSRDNIAAKIQHLSDADLYLVWSGYLKHALLKMYPEIDPQRVRITGSPQFDYHLDPAYRIPREEFFERVGLSPHRPLVVYTLATPRLIDHEIEIAQHLADAAHAGRLAGRAQLLVRGHPRMFGSSHPLLHREYPEAKVWPKPEPAAYDSPQHNAVVVARLREDTPMHYATIAYQNVQVNICGTMTIDSAILDKPTVHVHYDLVANVPPGLRVETFYERSDVKQMLSYGAARAAYSPEECIQHINAYLENPDLDAQGRRRAREEDCGPLDGRAGERIAALLLELSGGRKGGETVR